MTNQTAFFLLLVVLFILGISVVGAFLITVLWAAINVLVEAWLGSPPKPPTFPHEPCL